MKLKRGLTGLMLLFSAAFVVLGCTCSVAYASGIFPAPAAETAPSCHKPEPETSSKSNEDCCGKCQLDRSAEIQSNSSSKLSQNQLKVFKNSIALPVREIYLKSPLAQEFLRLDAGDLLKPIPDYSPAIPRAPPVI